MTDYNLGTARGKIEIDASGAKQGGKDASDAADGAKKSWTSASGGIKKAGIGLTASAAVVGAAFGVAIKSAADFEAKISGIAAVSGATGPQLDQIRAKALQLGKDTVFSASEAASAMEELIKAGIPLKDVLQGAADAAVALAAAGGVSIPEAAGQISNAMNAFHIAAKDVSGVSDIIAGAANASAIDVGEFGQSLKQVGAVAHLAGLDFEDTAVAIAEMGQAGIKGSDAGTSLKTFLNNLIPTTDKQIALSKKLGLITKDGSNAFFDQTGKVKSLAAIQQTLSTSLKGMSQEQKLAALQTLFGSDAIRAAAVLADNGAAGYTKMADAMGKVSAADVAKTRMDNLNGSLEQMKGSLETVGIAIGEKLLPAIRSIVDFVTRLLNAFLNLSPGMQTAIIAFVGITAAIVAVAGIVLTIIGVIGTLLTVMAPVAAIFEITAAALLGWVAVIILVVALVVALAIAIYMNWGTIKDFVINLWNTIKDFLIGVWDAIYAKVASWVAAVSSAISTGWQAIAGFFSSVWAAITGTVSAAVDAVTGVVTAGIAIVSSIVSAGLGAIQAVWSAIWGTFGPLIEAVLNLIKALFILWWTIVKGIFLLELQALQTVITTVWNAIQTVISTVMNAIQVVIQTVWGIIGPYITGAVNAIKNTITSVFNAIKATLDTIWGGVKTAALAVWAVISAYIASQVALIKSVIATLVSIVATVVGFFQGIYDGVKTKVGEMVSFLGTIGSQILNAIGDVGSLLFHKGAQIVQSLIDGIASKLQALADIANKLTLGLSSHLPGSPVKEGPLRVLNRGYAGGQIIKMLADGMQAQLPALQATIGGITNTMAPTLMPSLSVAMPTPAPPVAGSVTYSIGDVLIPAKDLEEMRTVQDFFDRIQQESRKRMAGV